DVDTYARALQQDIRAIGQQFGTSLSFQQAQVFGVPQQTLSRLVTNRAFDHETARIGLSIGDEALAEELRSIPNFQGPDGSFDRTAYSFALQNIGLNETQFEETLREEAARTLLQTSVVAGTNMPATYATTLVAHALEERDATYAILPASARQADIPAATDDDLRGFYDANIERYTAPETRDITYAWVTPDMLLDSVDVDEDLMRASYQERFDAFNTPERRLVEQLVMPDADAAQAALDRIAAGGSFEDEVAQRGLDLTDVDLGDVTRADLGDAGDVVFAADVGSLAGPAPSAFGPAIFRINAILPAQETPFEEAREALRRDLALDRARRLVSTVTEDAENELAAGVTLEEIADLTELRTDQITWSAAATGGIADYPAFRGAASQATVDDFPELVELGDGGVFALRLNAVTPPTPMGFDTVSDRVAADWQADQAATALRAQADALATQLGEGQTFDALGLTPISRTGLTRTD
ncbi:MAG: peptidyl-prolyl cis-trans isomerase, partial [Paracoccaceae bacterium]